MRSYSTFCEEAVYVLYASTTIGGPTNSVAGLSSLLSRKRESDIAPLKDAIGVLPLNTTANGHINSVPDLSPGLS